MADETFRILADHATTQRVSRALTRRGFLGVAGLGAASVAFLAACGGSSDDSGTSATTTGGGGGGSTTPGSVPTSIDTTKTTFNMYTWAEYNDPDLLQSFGNITIDVYNSNEDAIAKLEAAQGTSGYDMVVPTGAYIPQMVEKGLLSKLNLDLIPNFSNLAEEYTKQPWDPENEYSVCKDWGTTGWIVDLSRVKTPIRTWTDFNNAVLGEAKGNTSVLDVPPDLCALYFWANDIPWTTQEPADLDACEEFIVNQLAPNLKAFDSFPGINLAQGNYALSQIYNGDARQGLQQVDDPERYAWGLGAPATELWMDNWCIVNGAQNVDAAYNFINFILVPENSAKDLEFHGYNTGIKGIEQLVPADLPYKDMIFFTAAQVDTMQPGEVNSAQQRIVDIYNKAKAAAGG